MSSLGYSEIDTQDNLENKYNSRLQSKEGIKEEKDI